MANAEVTTLARVNLVFPCLSKGPTLPRLTERESELMVLVSQGYSNRMIADTLAISVRTVESHKRNIRERLGVETMTHALADWLRSSMICD